MSTTAPASAAPSLPASAAVLLAGWWSRPLPHEVSRWAASADVAAVVAVGLGTAPSDLPRAQLVEVPTLLDEYERLFVGPGTVPCPPYESYWREDVAVDLRRSLMGPCTTDLGAIYARLGLRPDPAVKEMPDHLAVELEALSVALTGGTNADLARKLLDEHLGPFARRLCRQVARESEAEFYRVLARLTPSWLAGMREALAQV